MGSYTCKCRFGYAEKNSVCTGKAFNSCNNKQQQQQQQHFISPHNIQEIKIYNSSTDDDRGAGCPKEPKS